MPKPAKITLLITILAIVAAAQAQQPNPSPLKPLAFLTGRWTSETPAEIQEENWSPIIGDSMTGSFRVIENGKPVFYEYWAVELDEAGTGKPQPMLKLKHYNAGLKGWEEKDASTKMPLVSSAENDVVFTEADGSVSLHYHREGIKLTCTAHHVKNGKGSDETFTLTKN